jgi:uncharacterized membrane protein
MHVGALTDRSKHVGVVIGALVNLIGIMLATFLYWSLSSSVIWLSGLGIAAGAMAGFMAAVTAHAGDDTKGIGSRSGAGAQE